MFCASCHESHTLQENTGIRQVVGEHQQNNQPSRQAAGILQTDGGKRAKAQTPFTVSRRLFTYGKRKRPIGVKPLLTKQQEHGSII